MDSTALLDQFRIDCDDRAQPPLWSDDEIYNYIDDAQKMFCRLTGGIGDASSNLTTLAYGTGADWVATSNLILKIRGAYNSADGLQIKVINYEDMATLGMRFDGRIGAVRYLIIGMEPAKARLYPFPNQSGAIQLLVERLPLKAITDAGQALEVPDQHKNGLVMWMRARAYGKQDCDSFDRGRAESFDAQFRQYCAAATTEKARARHKTRTTAYGGI